MINVLYYEDKIGIGGIEKMMLQWVEHSAPGIHIDLFTSMVVDETTRQKFISHGCEVFEANCSVRNLLKKAQELAKVLRKKKYDIVHIHTSMATDFLILAIAKKHGVQYRIAHSHNVPIFAHLTTRWADKICKPLLRYYTTNFYGCSKQAAIALFGNKKKYLDKYVVIKNGIDTDLYKFSTLNRDDMRKEFGIAKDNYVIGSVGRMDFQKNYLYLLTTVARMSIDKSKITLLIIGDGYERDTLKEYASTNNIQLIMPGKRNDVNKIYSCFDLFVLTSRYEGFPVVMMEAQANGVDCLVSEAIPEEAILYDSCIRLSLGNELQWIDALTQHFEKYHCDIFARQEHGKVVKTDGYSIDECASKMSEDYKTIISNS